MFSIKRLEFSFCTFDMVGARFDCSLLDLSGNSCETLPKTVGAFNFDLIGASVGRIETLDEPDVITLLSLLRMLLSDECDRFLARTLVGTGVSVRKSK